jgi:hypothetical protein
MRDARRTKRSLPGTARVLLALIVLSAWPAIHADPSALSSVERDTNSHMLQVLERRGERLEASFVAMERSARRFHRWLGCISLLPVDEVGDPNHRFGFAYDEMDGTKLDHRPAFVVGDRHERTDYHVLTFAHRDECQSHPTRPGTPGHPGTADPARTVRREPLGVRLRRLERLVADLSKRVPALDRMSRRFDEWESCLTMVGVTEYGDPRSGFGYLFESSTGSTFMPAIAVDISEWDDPDYFILTFKGRNRPFVQRECRDNDGEDVDRSVRMTAPSRRGERRSAERVWNVEERINDVRQEMDSLGEDVEDLLKAVGEFEIFDQCMHLMGVSEFGAPSEGTGYVFVNHDHSVIRPALAMDGASFATPEFQFLVYPGEEPPSIECNEDAEPRPPNSQ